MGFFKKEQLPAPSAPTVEDIEQKMPLVQVSDQDFMDPNQEVRKYIGDALQAGLAAADIRARLRKSGWPDKIIEQVFAELQQGAPQGQAALQNFVKEQLNLGYSREVITRTLEQQGYDAATIATLFQAPASHASEAIAALQSFITQKRAAGYSERQITEVLLAQGWKQRIIDEQLLK